MNYHIQEFHETIQVADDRGAVWEGLLDFVGGYGIEHAAYGFGVRPGLIEKHTTLPDSWEKHYQASGYGPHDQLVHHCMQKSSPLLTNMARDMERSDYSDTYKKMLREVSDFGFRNGIVLPLRLGPRYPPAGINLITSFEEPVFAREIERRWPEIQNATFAAHVRIMEILSAPTSFTAKLSPRQRDVLTYLACGLKRDKISEKLGITVQTVDEHLREVRNKTESGTTYEALAKAIIYQLIEI